MFCNSMNSKLSIAILTMYSVKDLPALLIRMFSLFSFSLNCFTKSRMHWRLARSRYKAMTSPFLVFLLMVLATASPSCWLRHARITLAPRKASSCAVAFPIPEVAPVQDKRSLGHLFSKINQLQKPPFSPKILLTAEGNCWLHKHPAMFLTSLLS